MTDKLSSVTSPKEYKDMDGGMIFYVNKRTGVKSVLESEDFKAAGGVAIFRQSIAVVNVGIFVALLGLLALIPAEETFLNMLVKITLIIGMGGAGIRLILDGIISRVYWEPERLVYRNFCGIKKAIYWQDIREVRSRHIETNNGFYEYLLVIGEDTKIKISWCYITYGALRSEIKKRRKQNTTDK